MESTVTLRLFYGCSTTTPISHRRNWVVRRENHAPCTLHANWSRRSWSWEAACLLGARRLQASHYSTKAIPVCLCFTGSKVEKFYPWPPHPGPPHKMSGAKKAGSRGEAPGSYGAVSSSPHVLMEWGGGLQTPTLWGKCRTTAWEGRLERRLAGKITCHIVGVAETEA